MTGTEFWQRMGLEPRLEDEYLECIQLSAGMHEFLQATASHFDSLWCLSNDVSEWSRKLRVRHEIAAYFTGFVISGDAGIRKPDPGIYNLLLSRLGRTAMDCTFVDDRVKNLDSAKALGFRTVLFGSDEESVLHPSVASFTKLTRWFLNTGP
jgi:putative hydrolase of the HAD superfamily